MKQFLQRILLEIMKKKNNTWNIRRSLSHLSKRTRVLYCRFQNKEIRSKQKEIKSKQKEIPGVDPEVTGVSRTRSSRIIEAVV